MIPGAGHYRVYIFCGDMVSIFLRWIIIIFPTVQNYIAFSKSLFATISQALVNTSRKPQIVRILGIQVFTLQRQSRHQSLNGTMYRSLDHVRER